MPMYQLFAGLGLLNSPIGLIVINITFAAPFSVWLMRGFLDAVPIELSEAAAVDGAGPITIMLRVVLPLLIPGVPVIAVYAFMFSWTEFTFASTLIIGDEWKTVRIGLSAIMGQYFVDWQSLTAGTVCAILPGLLFFALVGRYFIQGLVAGAVKQ